MMSSCYDVEILRRFAQTILQHAGLSEEPAGVVAAGLLEADLYGHDTHGLALLEDYVEELENGTMTRQGQPEILQNFGAIARWNAKRLPGIWTTSLAIEDAIQRASQFGIAAISIAHSHHIGCLAAFLERPAREGFAILVLSSDPSDAHVAPYGGRTPVLTPNPVAVGIPADPDPILVDISMSITTAGRCARARHENQSLPAQWLLDNTGQPSADPKVLNQGGSILPIGGLDHGHKGYALGLTVELLTQGLGDYGRADSPTEWGAAVLVLAFAPQAFTTPAAFTRQVNEIIARCQAATPRSETGQIRLPGERALANKRAALTHGIALQPSIAATLERLATRYGLDLPPHYSHSE